MKLAEIFQKSFFTLVGLTCMTAFTPHAAQAATLVKLSFNQANLSDPTIRIADICPEFACQPNEVFFANNVNTPIITLLNNTGFTITGFRLKLLDNQDAVFEQASSQLFNNVTLLNNNTEVVFSGGVLPVNAAATFIIDSGVNTVTFSASISGTPVSTPEPGSVVGTLIALGALAGSSMLKKQLDSYIAQ